MDIVKIPGFKLDKYKLVDCFSFTKDQKKFYVLGINGNSAILDKKLHDDLINKTIDNNFLFKLIGLGLITDEVLLKDNVLPSFFMVDFSTKCNLNCVYCLRHFENQGTIIPRNKLKDILDYILNYCFKNNIKDISFQPWGGEPLLALDNIIFAKEYFDNAHINARFSVQTNGLLLTKEVFELLKSHQINIGLSIDGRKFVQDKQRPDIKGNATFDRIVKNLLSLDKKDIKSIGVISIYTSDSFDEIKENVNCLRLLGIENFKFNLVHPNGKDFNFRLLLKDDEVDSYVDSLFECFSDDKMCNEISESNLCDKLFNLILKNKYDLCHSRGCRGGLEFISFDQNGNFYPCEQIGDKSNMLGNIYENDDLLKCIEEGKKIKPFYIERDLKECSDCPFIYFCKGGCRSSAAFNGRKPEEIDLYECKINKKIYPKLIELILENPEKVNKILKGRIYLKTNR